MLIAQLIVFFLIVQVIIRPVMSAYQFTRPPRLRVTFRTPADWGVAYHDVQFSGRDGIALDGWYVPSRNGAAVVLLHGHSGNRLATAYHAETLAQAGYGVLLFDLRAHGSSQGRRFTLGREEVDDVLAAVAFVGRQRDVTGLIGVLGISVGGALALQAAARGVAIRAVAVDGPSPVSIEDLPPATGLLDRFWRYPLERYHRAALAWFSGGEPLPSTATALRRLAPRPVLFLSSGRGAERRLTRHFYDEAAQPKRWWEATEAGHAAGWRAEPDAYGREIAAFFDQALLGALRPDPEAGSDGRAGEDSRAAAGPTSASDECPVVAEYSLALQAAVLVALAAVALGMMALLIPYQLRWGLLFPGIFTGPPPPAWAASLLLLLLLTPLLHGLIAYLSLRLAGGVPAADLRLAAGGRLLTPLLISRSPVAARAYRRALLLPALLLGVAPAAGGLLLGSLLLLVWGWWGWVLCSSDLAVLWLMRRVDGGAAVRPHSSRAGCYVLDCPDEL